MKSIVYAATILAIALCVRVANASGPIAIYALMDKVTLEPGTDKPDRIRISGVFITSEERPGAYASPQRGYLYFTLPAGNEELARREWADLKAVAGTRQVVGFGSSWGVRIPVRKTAGEATSPGPYPMGNGVIKVNSEQPRAKALLDYKDR
jgi:hypothetical protein